ncbi:carboxyl transferase domain-containing protein [Ornithinimicrobium cerasi]|uniref:Acetyl-coenzyme A carboxylase carboxyl transferase subunits beta/alpha n=1 Tax=Ornithinimicrobium cerasi TaxID=2248773 RepID=A0A285VMT8_9MICO|nr:carboxyl transferase domain-containing protein [Ornithinimicrobium cerasi]SOC55385.1 acetyl-CoA carboxylase carboxyl transferase subunit beta [Ornithinimicrobium cerasi]
MSDVRDEQPGRPHPDAHADYETGDGGVTRDLLDRRPVVPRTVSTLYETRPGLNPTKAIGRFLEAVNLQERHGHMRVVDDLIGLQRRVGDTIEHYRDKLLNAEARSGSTESAKFGIGHFNGQRAVVYVVDWAFFAGSLGEVAGEKFVQAAELAERERLPLVSMGASSGVRQHENVLGLIQMQRMAAAANKFQHTTNRPYISVLAGQVWGGMSASAVPVADLVVALEGTDYGFAGRRVIETFEGRAVPKGMQSAEANYLDRNVDLLVKDVDELIEWLGRIFDAGRSTHRIRARSEGPTRPADVLPGGRPVTTGPEGFSAALWDHQVTEQVVQVPRARRDQPDTPPREALMARYNEIAAGAGRLDTEFYLQNVFDSAVPFYNHLRFEEEKKYPNIIAGLGIIGDTTFMVIGDQPCYQVSAGYVGKSPANPGPEDFEYGVRMMQAAQRWGLPIVFFTDTLGALPTMAAERRGQSRAIAQSIKTSASHPFPTVSVIAGAMGSGGGLATTPFGRHTVMLDSALGFVSEPRSTATILYNESNPSVEQVAMTLETMRASADDLRHQGLVDVIVTDEEDPYLTARELRVAIVEGYNRQVGLTPRRLRQKADERLRPRTLGKLAADAD